MIGGFIVNGNAPKNLAVRGIGPSLTGFGISDALTDPTLELRDGSGALLTDNDDWQSFLPHCDDLIHCRPVADQQLVAVALDERLMSARCLDLRRHMGRAGSSSWSWLVGTLAQIQILFEGRSPDCMSGAVESEFTKENRTGHAETSAVGYERIRERPGWRNWQTRQT